MQTLADEFVIGAGTYLKVVQFAQPANPDGFLVLYLRPAGQFLFLGYWRGYERSLVAGTWTMENGQVELHGGGNVSAGSHVGPRSAQFARVLLVQESDHTPVLVASTDLEGWSLLSWRGPYAYVGKHTIIDPDGEWLPRSMSMVDELIQRVLG